MSYYLVFLLCLSVVCLRTEAQENTICKTPNGIRGICINIRKCDQVLEILKRSQTNPLYVPILKQTQCGRGSNGVLVCCPDERASQPQVVEPVSEKPSVRSYVSLPTTAECVSGGESKFPRVVGGFDVEQGQFPWLVAIGYDVNHQNPKWLCGGTIITKRHILTAAHCIHQRPDLFIVRAGVLNIYDSSNPIDLGVEQAIQHPEYDQSRLINDIGILRLNGELPYTDNIRPICLPNSPDIRGMTFERKFPFIAGWGALYFNGPSSSTLKGLQLPIVSNTACKSKFASYKSVTIDERLICAGFERGMKDSCQGDSGGPLMIGLTSPGATNIAWYQIGVISYGFRCAEPGYPGVYTRVTAFMDWILQNLY